MQFWQAGAKALTRSANEVGVSFFDQALAALDKLPNTAVKRVQEIDLRFDLRSALMPLGEFERTHQILREAEVLAASIGDQRRLGWSSGMMANLLWELGEQERAVAAGERALRIAVEVSDDALQNLSYRYLGRSYAAQGDYSRAVTTLEGVLKRRQSDSQHRPRPWASPISQQIWLAYCLSETGAFAAGIAYGEEAIRLAETNDQRLNLIAACAVVGRLYLRQGHIDESTASLERGLELCRNTNIPLLFPLAASALGAAHALAGRTNKAVALLEEAVDRALAMRRMVDQSLSVAWLSEALMRAGQLERAHELAQQALELAIKYQERGNRAWVLRLLGELYSCLDGAAIERAAPCYQEALDQADKLGMRPLQAHCHLGLCLLNMRRGRTQEAKSSVRIACALFRDMNMKLWLPEGEVARARLQEPAEP
jgi:tetratricopeptide (TPR) repeat protein